MDTQEVQKRDLLTVQNDITDEVSPGGSPLTQRKLVDFLAVNGNFGSDILPSSNASTASSSLCPSPMPQFYLDEYEQTRRLSLSPCPEYATPTDELKNIKDEVISQNRRHSILTSTPTDCKDFENECDSGRTSPKLPAQTFDPYIDDSPDDNQNLHNNQKNCYPNCDVNVWLRSCEKEIIEPIKGIVQGTIPSWLNGALLRNGPGSLKVGNMNFKHLFDSSALLHRFNIINGQVTYQCRFLQSDTYIRNKAANRIVVSDFGTSSVPDPCQSIFSRISALFKPGEALSDNAMISVYPFGDEYFTFTETPVIHKISTETLATEERINLFNYIGIVNHTAHPHVLPDGTVYNLGMTVTKTGPNYVIICFPCGENMFKDAHIVASMPVRWRLHPGYMHSFGITENYFIIVEQPLTVSVTSMVKGQLTNQPMSSSLKWFSEKQTHIYVLDRVTGELKFTFYAETFFYLHIINQYEKDNHIVLDICCYKDPSMLNCMYVDSMKKMQDNPNYAKLFRGRPLRFVLPLIDKKSNSKISNLFPTIYKQKGYNNLEDKGKKNGKFNIVDDILKENFVKLENTKAKAYRLPNGTIFCKPELLCDFGCETPRINYDLNLGCEYQYFYGISSDVDADNPGTLIKVDVKNKTKKLWCEQNVYPSEPIFVSSPQPKSEDDGVVLAAIVWGNELENRVGLLVLCAKTWNELGRCEFTTPGPVPKCLHGWFAPSKKMNNNFVTK